MGVRVEARNPARKVHTRVYGNLFDLFHNHQIPHHQATREMATMQGLTVWMLPKPHTPNTLLQQPHEHPLYAPIPWFSVDLTLSIVDTAHFEITRCNINIAL
jgi:hypothetical protein